MVPKAGLEPARISTVDFESTASTDFATSALQVVCGKRVHYTFQRSTCNTYPLFNELSAEKIVAEVTLGPFCGPACGSNPETNIRAQHAAPLRINIGKCVQQTSGRGMQRPYVLISARAAPPGHRNKKGVTQWLHLLKLPAVPLLAF